MEKKLSKKNILKKESKTFYRIITIIFYELPKKQLKMYYTLLKIIFFDTFLLEMLVLSKKFESFFLQDIYKSSIYIKIIKMKIFRQKTLGTVD